MLLNTSEGVIRDAMRTSQYNDYSLDLITTRLGTGVAPLSTISNELESLDNLGGVYVAARLIQDDCNKKPLQFFRLLSVPSCTFQDTTLVSVPHIAYCHPRVFTVLVSLKVLNQATNHRALAKHILEIFSVLLVIPPQVILSASLRCKHHKVLDIAFEAWPFCCTHSKRHLSILHTPFV